MEAQLTLAEARALPSLVSITSGETRETPGDTECARKQSKLIS